MKEDAQRDVKFLEEAEERLQKGRDGDPTELEYLAEMLRDWREELHGFDSCSSK